MYCKTQIQYLLQSTKLVPGYVLQNTNPLVIVRKDIDVNEHVLPKSNPVYMYYQVLILYVLPNSNPVCITKYVSSAFFYLCITKLKSSIYVLPNLNPVYMYMYYQT